MIWLLNIIPDFVIHLAIVFSCLVLLASLFPIPYVLKYKQLIRVMATLLIIVASYFEGAIAYQQKAESQIKELQLKIAKLEKQSAVENVKIVEKVVTVEKVIKQKANTIKEYIDREVVKYDHTCVIPSEFIEAHNKSAEKP
jgi:cytochrome c biogenesis protein CcdA